MKLQMLSGKTIQFFLGNDHLLYSRVENFLFIHDLKLQAL